MNCTQCGMELILKPAGVSRTTGKPYDAFWACSSGQRHKQSKPSYDAQNSPTSGLNSSKPNMSNIDPMVLVGDELTAIRKRLDDMATYLKSKLG